MAQKAVSIGRRMASALLPVALVARPERVKAEEVDDVAQVVFQPTARVNQLSPTQPMGDESSAAMATVLSLGQRLAKRPEIQKAVEDELSSWVLVPGGLPVPSLRVHERVERLLEASDQERDREGDREVKDQESKQQAEDEDDDGVDLLSPEVSPLAQYLVHSLSQPGSQPGSEQQGDEQKEEEQEEHEEQQEPGNGQQQAENAVPDEQFDHDEQEGAPARDAPAAEASVHAPQPPPSPSARARPGFWSRLGSSIRTLLFGSATHSPSAQAAHQAPQTPRAQEEQVAADGAAADRERVAENAQQQADEGEQQQQEQQEKDCPRAQHRETDLPVKQIALGVAGALILLVLVRRVNPTLFKSLAALARRALGL